jgi:hypothetical protein
VLGAQAAVRQPHRAPCGWHTCATELPLPLPLPLLRPLLLRPLLLRPLLLLLCWEQPEA